MSSDDNAFYDDFANMLAGELSHGSTNAEDNDGSGVMGEMMANILVEDAAKETISCEGQATSLQFPTPASTITVGNPITPSTETQTPGSVSWGVECLTMGSFIKTKYLDDAAPGQDQPPHMVTPVSEGYRVVGSEPSAQLQLPTPLTEVGSFVSPTPQLQLPVPASQLQFPDPQPTELFQVVSPPNPIRLPVTREKPAPEADKPPKKHRPLDPPQAANPFTQLLKIKTLQCQGFITSPDSAAALRKQYTSLSRQAKYNTSRPENDATFPQNDQEYCSRVREMFEAICDWSKGDSEWRARMGQKRVRPWLKELSQVMRQRGLDGDVSKMSDDEVVPPVERMPALDEQWMNVVHRPMSDVEIELLCADILVNLHPFSLIGEFPRLTAIERGHQGAEGGELHPPLEQQRDPVGRVRDVWGALEPHPDCVPSECLSTSYQIASPNAQQFNKVLIHSALRAPWISRIANSPYSETKRKSQNKAGNDRKRNLIEQGGSEKKKAKLAQNQHDCLG
ncbi:hypothetical protein ACJZ2D_001087 [Fusarium nematophilum]